MSGHVITLDGLPTKSVGGKRCGNLVTVHSSVTGEDYKVCESDLPRVNAAKRGPGRPKGSTVIAGARRPKVGTCEVSKKIRTRNGVRCQCTAPHKQFVKCGTTPQ